MYQAYLRINCLRKLHASLLSKMNNHPLNLALRFILELLALYIVGYWGYTKGEGVYKYIFMLLIPLILATAWAVFRVPGDPGRAPVAVNGIIRLTIEASVFGIAVFALFDTGYDKYGWILLAVLIVHYAISYDRLFWIIKQ